MTNEREEIVSQMKPCPFCGHTRFDGDHYEYLHRFATYSLFWQINCPSVYGGCDVAIIADSPQECLERWNRRVDSVDDML